MKNKIIAYSGAHGTGKTTAVYQMAAGMKKNRRGEVGIFREYGHRKENKWQEFM